MKIGRNEPCPCGSGKKYKKCCIDKQNNNMNNNKYSIYSNMDMFSYHNNYIHTKQVKNKDINDKLLYTYDNYKKLTDKVKIDNFLIVMNYILDYAEENNIRSIEKLDKEELIAEFIGNVISDFELEIENLSKDSYDFNVLINYIDRLTSVLDLEYNMYENIKRCKTNSLFKMGDYELGEKVMLDLIDENHNSIYPYVELVDDFDMVGMKDKARYYYDLGMQHTNFKDLDVLKDRIDYFEK